MNENTTLSTEDKKQALKYYILGYNIQTIADHFKISVDCLKRNIKTE